MTVRLLVAVLMVAVVVLTAGCYRRVQESFAIQPIAIESVEVIKEPRVQAAVTGIIGDGCSEFDGVNQERTGNTVTVFVTRKQRTTGECRDQIKTFDRTIELRGDFPPGAYQLSVNGTTVSFTIP
jgi:type IV pilus biogenesis protein CpaD/CtpE